MRLYSDDFLSSKTKPELKRILEGVQRNDAELTKQEQERNIENIEMYLFGNPIAAAIAADMVAGQADISDIGDM